MRNNADDNTIAYYDKNSESFAKETLETDLSPLIEKFLALLPPSDICEPILDLGCGAGRDSLAMIERGYDVDLVDGSAEMCRIASQLTGRKARQMLFSELDAKEAYSGIWACASLLHVPRSELFDVLRRCRNALVPDGVLYSSFQLGEHDGIRRGRYYTDMTPDEICGLLADVGGFEVIEVFVSEDTLKSENRPRWVNVFARKK